MTVYFDQSQEKKFLDAEWESIAEQRGYSPEEAKKRREQLHGLALSGGGIRSASFALGVLQGLAGHPNGPTIDYLSTVSGGGYIGSTLSWLLHKEPPDDSAASRQALTIGDRQRSTRNIGDQETIKIRDAVLNYIRQHGSYLNPTSCINFISLIAVVARSVFLSFSVYFSLLILLLVALAWVSTWLLAWAWSQVAAAQPDFESLSFFLVVALGLVAVFLAACIVYSLFTFTRFGVPLRRYIARIWVQCAMGWLWTLTVFFALVGSLPLVSNLLNVEAWNLWEPGLIGVLSTLLGFAGAFSEFLQKAGLSKGANKPLSGLLARLAAALLIYGLLLLAYNVANSLMEIGGDTLFQAICIGLAAYALVVGLIVNLNFISLHRMYRDRLMETFLPNERAIRKNRWYPATEADHTLLEALRGNAKQGPYHLINTNVVLVDAVHAKYRGRGGDSFILSPFYCGSHATGWRQTDKYMKTPFSRGMTLPTAMAVSGAAVNPDSGVAGKGLTRNRTISFLMTMLNIRLGYWAPNPCHLGNRILPPNYFLPGLKGLRGKGFDETSFFIELTDGGHFENIGLYELIRRRARLIVVSDGTADPNFTFSDFGNAVERVRVDFGVNIRFGDGDTDLEGILPGSAPITPDSQSDDAFRKKYAMAARGYAIGQIHYPPREQKDSDTIGTVVYIKSTLTKNLPTDIYGYKSANPSFPDQPTSDQFFDESQLEAYRELGYRLAMTVPWDAI